MPYASLVNTVNEIYEEIVTFRRNLFKLPTGKSGKIFIGELTFWLHQFNISSKLNSVALKIFMIFPTLMLQKPSTRSKAKDHSECLAFFPMSSPRTVVYYYYFFFYYYIILFSIIVQYLTSRIFYGEVLGLLLSLFVFVNLCFE